ncbi:MAG: hypothetical protein HZC46_10560 [Ignavibacterium album]|nr:hypothetical protein [Ignavibacterium album]
MLRENKNSFKVLKNQPDFILFVAKILKDMKNKPLVLLVLFLLISCSANRDYLPEDFWGMKLKRKLTGKEAKDFVDKLHFQNVATEKNEVGFYSGSVGNAAIYITYYSDDKAAYHDFRKMTQKITPENSMFVRGTYHNINNKQIYSCMGLGQVHYVFAHENLLFWVSADPNFSRNFLDEYMKFVIN